MAIHRKGKVIFVVSIILILLAAFAACIFCENGKLSSLTANKLGRWRQSTTITIPL